MKFIRPEIMYLISRISGGFKYTGFNQIKMPKTALFDFFDYGGNIYKEKFISHFNGKQHKDDMFFVSDDFDKFKPKVGGIFTNRNTFNIFYIMYKKAKSLNKYGIKKYLFKRYLETNYLDNDKLKILKDAVLDFYTNEEDINRYILGNKDFIYKGYSEEELEVLYKMGLFVKEDNDVEESIFNNYKGFKLIDIILIGNISNEETIGKGKIFANDNVYNYFLFFYNNATSYRKIYARGPLLKSFLSKDKITLNSAIKNIGLLIDYVKSLDEIFSTPYYGLLDDLVKLDNICKEYDNSLYNNRNSYLTGDINEEFDKNANEIYSDIELDILSIFYDINRIERYTYYDNNEYMDSSYLEDNEDNKNKKLSLSYGEFSDLLN